MKIQFPKYTKRQWAQGIGCAGFIFGILSVVTLVYFYYFVSPWLLGMDTLTQMIKYNDGQVTQVIINTPEKYNGMITMIASSGIGIILALFFILGYTRKLLVYLLKKAKVYPDW